MSQSKTKQRLVEYCNHMIQFAEAQQNECIDNWVNDSYWRHEIRIYKQLIEVINTIGDNT